MNTFWILQWGISHGACSKRLSGRVRSFISILELNEPQQITLFQAFWSIMNPNIKLQILYVIIDITNLHILASLYETLLHMIANHHYLSAHESIGSPEEYFLWEICKILLFIVCRCGGHDSSFLYSDLESMHASSHHQSLSARPALTSLVLHQSYHTNFSGIFISWLKSTYNIEIEFEWDLVFIIYVEISFFECLIRSEQVRTDAIIAGFGATQNSRFFAHFSCAQNFMKFWPYKISTLEHQDHWNKEV